MLMSEILTRYVWSVSYAASSYMSVIVETISTHCQIGWVTAFSCKKWMRHTMTSFSCRQGDFIFSNYQNVLDMVAPIKMSPAGHNATHY